MIQTLRKKFVVVTMLLMTTTLGILFFIDNRYTEYWEEQDILEKLEWYAKDETLFSYDSFEESGTDNYMNPVFAVQLDKDHHIVHVQSSSKANRLSLSDSDIEKIYEQPAKSRRFHSFLYVISERSDGDLLVITDTSSGKDEIYQRIGDFLLFAAGLLVLLIISIFLSRFVTGPAEKAFEREKQFISDASHELKTPLAAISVNAHALSAEVDADNTHLKHILSETRRMDALIQKLLKLSYVEEAGDRIQKQDFSLSDCCKEMVLSLECSIYEKKIHFDYQIENDISYFGNEGDIKQVITILLDNAMKHTPADGEILFSLSRSGKTPVIKVENTGQGIAPQSLPHIFERFYSLNRSGNPDKNSYGLGLSIAKAILDAHDARIFVESDYGKNVCFTIRF